MPRRGTIGEARMKLVNLLGIGAFWLTWPLLFVYLRIGRRTRVLLVADNKVLVVQTWLGPGKWALPGGGLHQGEDAADGVLRELREETGINLNKTNLRHLGQARLSEYGLSFLCERFVAQVDRQLPIKRQWYEITKAAWIDPQELNTKNSIVDVVDLLEVCRGQLNLIK